MPESTVILPSPNVFNFQFYSINKKVIRNSMPFQWRHMSGWHVACQWCLLRLSLCCCIHCWKHKNSVITIFIISMRDIWPCVQHVPICSSFPVLLHILLQNFLVKNWGILSIYRFHCVLVLYATARRNSCREAYRAVQKSLPPSGVLCYV